MNWVRWTLGAGLLGEACCRGDRRGVELQAPKLRIQVDDVIDD